MKSVIWYATSTWYQITILSFLSLHFCLCVCWLAALKRMTLLLRFNFGELFLFFSEKKISLDGKHIGEPARERKANGSSSRSWREKWQFWRAILQQRVRVFAICCHNDVHNVHCESALCLNGCQLNPATCPPTLHVLPWRALLRSP